ncbi:MAG: PfkB family carbohydrate kinase [Solirubrobacterales bacterium]
MTDAILVWNPNPTLDVVSEVSALAAGGVHRADRQEVAPGGKGTLVLRTLAALGVDSHGVAPLAGPTGNLVGELFERDSLPIETTEVDGQTRVAVSIVDGATGTDTVVNGPGPKTGGPAWEAHLVMVERLLGSGRFRTFVVAGRPPLGGGDAGLARLCGSAGTQGLRVVLDLSSPLLEEGLRANPWLVKVNLEEARAVVGNGEPIEELCRRGAANVVLTDGPNAIQAKLGGDRLVIVPPSVRPRSAVGCGDCFLGALLWGLRDHPDDPAKCLRRAAEVASAAAETLQPASFSPRRAAELRARGEQRG